MAVATEGLFSDKLMTDISQAPSLEREARGILQAKQGISAEPGLATPTNIYENVALNQAKAQEQAQFNQFQLQEEQADLQRKEARQRESFERKKLTQQAINVKNNFVQKSSSILQKFQQDQDAQKFQRKAASTEQLGFYLRLNNDKYIDKLKTEGAKARLSRDVNFREQSYLTAFRDEIDMFRNNLTFRKQMNQEDRVFKAEMAIYNLTTALELAMAGSEQNQTRTMFEAGGMIASAGAQIYTNYSPEAGPYSTWEGYSSGDRGSPNVGNRLTIG